MKKILDKVTSAPKAVSSHVYRNRGRYGIVTGIIVGGVVVRHLDNETYKEAIAFIEQKGLSDEFFLSPEDFAELA
jgi:hypothetical protein